MDWRPMQQQTTLTGPQRAWLAMAVLAQDPTARGIARYAEIDLAEAERVLSCAKSDGIFEPDGHLGDWQRTRLIADLDTEHQAVLHARVAGHLLAEGPTRLAAALEHLRAAATLADPEPAVELADHAGRLSLSLGDYVSAAALLALAADYDVSPDLSRQGHRLCDLAAACDGLGDMEGARRHAARAVALGELAHDAALVARAAIAHTLPVDWHAGDQRTHGLLARAAQMPLAPVDRVAITAARALAEMRIPVIAGAHHQVAWVTRPGVAQPLAVQALHAAADAPPWVQCLALLAWRSTHRAPEHLEQRFEISSRALEVAQRLRHASFQVEAAVWLAVDALEGANREGFDEALSVAQWVAQSDGNPRLHFRASTLALGAALLDGGYQRARALLQQTSDMVGRLDASLRMVVDTLFLGQILISEDDPDVLAELSPPTTSDILAHPLGRSGAAYFWARAGRTALAVEQTRRALVQRDPESSLLLVGTRAAAVALETGDESLCREVLDLLTPYAHHVAVDSNGWWCDGPVAVWLAMLHQRLGHHVIAHRHLVIGERWARSLRDARSLRRVDMLRSQLPSADDTTMVVAGELTPRELDVLRHLAGGATNVQIARQLTYSVSTIRNDTMSIYRKLGVHGRPDAVATAVAFGLIEPPR